ncbi:DUF4259 domain-containing protein [Streptomyces sp. NPDC088746]|uniref:DUF4259 domain-containing protein n=1 Tax=Streptomyces sp. NPDC088746 TaxID=3365885 RepID=UPI0037FD3893
MGTWDIGPFGNDMAADFAYTLDEVPKDKRESLVRATGRLPESRPTAGRRTQRT